MLTPEEIAQDQTARMYYHHHRNVRFAMDQIATQDTANFAFWQMPGDVVQCPSRIDTMTYAANLLKETMPTVRTPVLEFGVASGESLVDLSVLFPDRPLFGFDSFEGLPEDWKPGFPKGSFAGVVPKVPAKAKLEVGWFSDTLPKWLAENDGYVDFIHIDCDLYSSSVVVLKYLKDHIRLRPGAVILFDEYFNYPGWRDHEHRALTEIFRSHEYEYKAFNYLGEQVVVQLK